MTIRITYDSKTVDLLIGPRGLDKQFLIDRSQARSGSGMIETINRYAIMEGVFDAYFTESVYQDLVAWWSWASQGQPFSLAMDTSEDSSTTLDATAAANQKVVPVADTSGFAAGDVCLIRSADRFIYEVVTVDSVSAGVSVTTVSNLKYPYVSGDFFRHLDYYPNAVILDEKFNPEKRGAYYSHQFHFVEEVDTMPTPRRLDIGSWGAPSTVTISGGILDLPGPGYYLVETEAGAATDDLNQITGLVDGDEVKLSPLNAAHTVVVCAGTYLKMQDGYDFQMDDAYDVISLMCVGTDTCKEISRAGNV